MDRELYENATEEELNELFYPLSMEYFRRCQLMKLPPNSPAGSGQSELRCMDVKLDVGETYPNIYNEPINIEKST